MRTNLTAVELANELRRRVCAHRPLPLPYHQREADVLQDAADLIDELIAARRDTRVEWGYQPRDPDDNPLSAGFDESGRWVARGARDGGLHPILRRYVGPWEEANPDEE